MDNLTIPIQVEAAVKSIDPAAKVILFGSRARQEAQEESDWDFLILTQLAINPELVDEIRTKLYFLELEAEQVISSVIEQKDKWEDFLNSEFYQNVQQDGIEIDELKAA